jgi:hypothetical protein
MLAAVIVFTGCSVEDEMASSTVEGQAAVELKDVTEAADTGMARFLESVPTTNLGLFGFTDEAELQRTQLGTPIPVYTLSADAVGMEALPQWRVPVTVDGTSRVFLTVAQMNGTLQAVALGGHELAEEIEAKQNVLATNLALLRLHALKADFVFELQSADAPEPSVVHPLTSATQYLGSDAPVTMEQVRDLQRQQDTAAEGS